MNASAPDGEGSRPRTPDEALERLLAGNARFVADRKLNQGHDAMRRSELAAGQEPFAVILGCSDSRVPAEIVFDQGLGDLFVVRVAGNTAANPVVVGSIEFAVETLGTSLVPVLGHEACGAVQGALAAATEGAEAAGAIGEVLAPIVPVATRIAADEPALAGDELTARAVVANVEAQVAELTTRSPAVAGRVEAGELLVAGAEYRLASGEVSLL
jgi:carbonic anhydrase